MPLPAWFTSWQYRAFPAYADVNFQPQRDPLCNNLRPETLAPLYEFIGTFYELSLIFNSFSLRSIQSI